MEGDHYQILWITEKEMDEFMQGPLRDAAAFPHYACIDRLNGAVRFWPKIDPNKFTLLAKQVAE